MKKIREEEHSISQPQPLEVVTDGDLEEVKKDPHEEENYNDAGGNPQKKDPVWKSWLIEKEEEKKEPKADVGEKEPEKEPTEFEEAVGEVEEKGQQMTLGTPVAEGIQGLSGLIGLSWKSWLEKREEEDLLPEDKPRPPTPKTPKWKRRKHEYTAQGTKVGVKPKEKKPKKEAFGLWDYKHQNEQKVRDQAQRIENERRNYPDEEGKRGPRTGRERSDRMAELDRKIRTDYRTERKRRNTEWTKQQNANFMNEYEEYEATVSSSNKTSYVERVGEAMKSKMFLFGGKVNRKTGKKAKLKPRTITLDEFTEKQNIIYHNKILPLISAVGSIGRVAMGAMSGDQKEMGEGGKDIGQTSEQAEDEKKQ